MMIDLLINHNANPNAVIDHLNGQDNGKSLLYWMTEKQAFYSHPEVKITRCNSIYNERLV